MFSMNKIYKDETKKVLNVLNDKWYSFSNIKIDLNNFKLILDDNNKTVISFDKYITIFELIHANLGTLKGIEFIY